jgi:protein-tyrosine phosphatase
VAALFDNDTLTPPQFSVLVVCTGNICRSPVAERLLLAAGTASSVGSAGTHAMRGQPISPPMISLLASVGADSGHFAARQLTETLLSSADLILTMTRDQRAAVVDSWPRAVRHSFTLVEFARLVNLVAVDDVVQIAIAQRFRALIALAAAQRHQVGLTGESDDIADPYRGSRAHYEVAFTRIRGAVATIVKMVRDPVQQCLAR